MPHQMGSIDSIVFSFQWARVLSEASRPDEDIEVLERALATSVRQDWEYRWPVIVPSIRYELRPLDVT